MVHTRTGQRPRWSFFHGPEHMASLPWLVCMTVWLGCLVPLGASLWAGWQGSEALVVMLDPRDPEGHPGAADPRAGDAGADVAGAGAGAAGAAGRG
jgi:hypothetical protein